MADKKKRKSKIRKAKSDTSIRLSRRELLQYGSGAFALLISKKLEASMNPFGMSNASPYRQFVYAAASGSDLVSSYRKNPHTGVISRNSPGHASTGAGSGPYSVGVSTSGRYVYAANRTTSAVYMFSLDLSNGALAPLGSPTIATGTNPEQIFIDPAGRFVYTANVGNSTVSVFTINASTGALTLSGTTNLAGVPRQIAVDPTGRFLFVTLNAANSVVSYTINSTTGLLTSASSTGSITAPAAIACHYSSRFIFVTSSSGNLVYPVGISSAGAFSVGTGVATGTNPSAATCDRIGQFLYVVNQGADTISQYSINQSTGVPTALTPSTVATGTVPVSVSTDPHNNMIYVANSSANNLSVYTSQLDGQLSIVHNANLSAGTTPRSVAAAPAVSRYAYISCDSGAVVKLCAIDPSTGALSYLSTQTIATNVSPQQIRVHPSGRFCFAANVTTRTISTYSISPFNGLLTLISHQNVSANVTGPNTMLMDPYGLFLFVGDFSNGYTSYSINQNTGTLTLVNDVTAGRPNYDLAMDPSGRFLYGGQGGNGTTSLVRLTITRTTGTLSAATTVATPASGGNSAVVDPTGRFLFVGLGSASCTIANYTIDPVTGVPTPNTNQASIAGSAGWAFGMVCDPAGRYLYVAHNDVNSASNIYQYNINQSTGVLSVGSSAVGAAGAVYPYSPVIDQGGRFLYVACNDTGGGTVSTIAVFAINPNTGAIPATPTSTFSVGANMSSNFLILSP